MAKKAAAESETIARPLPQTFPGLTLSAVNREVTCVGGGAYDGVWLVPAPLPQELSQGVVTYDLSDRAAGVYTWRHR